MGIVAVGSMPVGEVSKEATTVRREVSLTPPPGSNLWEDSQTVPKVPLKETPETFSRAETLKVFLHDPWLLRYTEGELAVSSGWQSVQEQQGLPFDSGTASYKLPEHDPLWAYVLDPGFTLPTPAPPLEPLVSAAGALTEGDLRDVLTQAGWPVELHDQAVAIVHCESRGRPDAVGDGGNSLGMFQLWFGWFSKAGYSSADYADPVVNATVARYVYEVRGRWGGGGGWSCAALVGLH